MTGTLTPQAQSGGKRGVQVVQNGSDFFESHCVDVSLHSNIQLYMTSKSRADTTIAVRPLAIASTLTFFFSQSRISLTDLRTAYKL